MEKIAFAVIAAMLFLAVPSAHALQQPTKPIQVKIAHGIVIKGDLMIVINPNANGSKAVQGPKGDQGPRGFPGPAGPQGIQGPPGPAGKNATVTVCQMTGTNICPIPKAAIVVNGSK